jgi:thiol-disulfide isomerase/thioredoxin
MTRLNKIPPKSAKENYEQFQLLRKSFASEEFNFVLFYGNPTETEVSWCPDCRPAHTDYERFVQNYHGKAHFHTVPIGPREEFNANNPFVKNSPFLEAVPTLIVFRGSMTYLKLVDPKFEDLVYFINKYKL